MNVDRARAERAITEFLRAFGLEPQADPELETTPKRVVDAFANEFLAGYGVDLAELIRQGSLGVGGAESPPGLVAVSAIDVATLCPHHLMPAIGSAAVAFLPGDRLLGIGTLAELVHVAARRLVLQEQLGQDIVQALMAHAGARGAFCRLAMRHTCLSARGGYGQIRAEVRTLATAGELARPEASAELALAFERAPRWGDE